MKNFFTSMLGTLVALVIFSAGCGLLFVGFIVAMSALGGDKSTPKLEKGSYVVLDLSTNISDAPAPVDLGLIGGTFTSATNELRHFIPQASDPP